MGDARKSPDRGYIQLYPLRISVDIREFRICRRHIYIPKRERV
jgi:hypothetical protein